MASLSSPLSGSFVSSLLRRAPPPPSPLNESLLLSAETAAPIASSPSSSSLDSPSSPALKAVEESASFSSQGSASSEAALAKRIGLLGSVALLVNNVTGGGLVLFAQVCTPQDTGLCSIVPRAPA